MFGLDGRFGDGGDAGGAGEGGSDSSSSKFSMNLLSRKGYYINIMWVAGTDFLEMASWY